MINSFTIRVYGILADTENNILVSDEIIQGKFYTKFPGGGLEIGEGTKDCLVREFKEETGLTITVKAHLYTTDFYQPSAFNETQQVLSIYYLVEATDLSRLVCKTRRFDFSEDQLSGKNQQENFRWMPLASLSENEMTLPIDKIVVRLLKSSRNIPV